MVGARATARRTPPGRARRVEPLRTTLVDIVEAVASLTPDTSELVVVVDHLLRSRGRWARARRGAERRP